MTLAGFLKRWNNFDFGFGKTRESMIDAGWYDWFCEDRSLYGRLERMAPCIKKVAKSKKFDPTKVGIFFKNNCPGWVNETYDDFRITDLETGEVMYTIIPKFPHHTLMPRRQVIHRSGHPIILEHQRYLNIVWDFTLTEDQYAGIRIDNTMAGKPVRYDEEVVIGTRKEVYAYFGV